MLKKLLTLTLAISFSASAFAADPVSQRQDIFKHFKHIMGSLGPVVNGAKPYNKDAIIKLATEMEDASKKPWIYFTADAKGRETKPEIWSKPEDFKKAISNFQTEATGLKTASLTGDLNAVKASFGTFQKTCKACHDVFRNAD